MEAGDSSGGSCSIVEGAIALKHLWIGEAIKRLTMVRMMRMHRSHRHTIH